MTSTNQVNINVADVKDEYAREALDTLQQTLESDLFRNFIGEFFEFEVPTGTFEVAHNLGYAPTDVIITNQADAVFDFNEADNEFIEITVTADTVIRCFLGSYRELS